MENVVADLSLEEKLYPDTRYGPYKEIKQTISEVIASFFEDTVIPATSGHIRTGDIMDRPITNKK